MVGVSDAAEKAANLINNDREINALPPSGKGKVVKVKQEPLEPGSTAGEQELKQVASVETVQLDLSDKKELEDSIGSPIFQLASVTSITKNLLEASELPEGLEAAVVLERRTTPKFIELFNKLCESYGL